jgi:hypothetical protein
VKKELKYKKQVELVFISIHDYGEQQKHNSLSFTIHSCDLQFGKLEQLSKLLKTKDINIYVVDDGRCHGHDPGEYCYCSNESELEIVCSKIKF